MSNHPKLRTQQNRVWQKRPLHWLGIAALFLLIFVVSCSPKTEPVTVEVTRVVTETMVTEGETVEVTRVVTETIVEEVEIAPEEQPGDLPSAIGSEGDAEPLPPPPNDGPKVTESRGSTQVAELAVAMAVTVRATNQTNPTSNSPTQVSLTAATTSSPAEQQKWCALIEELYKKRCS